MSRIAIVGGGITGLAAAYDLERTTDAEIDLHEASPRLGGKLRTDAEGDLLVEGGPDCFFARKPGAMEFVRELGLAQELVAPTAGEFGMVVDGALHLVPRGLVTLNAPDAAAIRESTFLSAAGKARALAPETVDAPDDLSIRAFFTGRYGSEFARLVAEPILAGTHGGDPDRLSMRALYPMYLEQGRTRGIDVPSMRPTDVPPVSGSEARDEPGTHRRDVDATFLSFRGGMQTLVDALARGLARTRVHLGARLDAIPLADRVLLALPANRAATLLPGIGLEAVPHRSSAIVTLAFRREDVGHPLGGTGFLVPPSESFPVTGATWSSEKWPGRAPDGTVLMRVFLNLRSADAPSALGARTPRPPEEQALDAIGPLLGITGEPILSRLDRWTDALPQYEIGHLDRVAAIESRLPEGVLIAGTSYRGVGVPDCLRQGREAARRIAQTL